MVLLNFQFTCECTNILVCVIYVDNYLNQLWVMLINFSKSEKLVRLMHNHSFRFSFEEIRENILVMILGTWYPVNPL